MQLALHIQDVSTLQINFSKENTYLKLDGQTLLIH